MNKGTVLLTLGRLPVALELARAFHSAGWKVIVAEPFRWPMTRLSRSVHKSIQVVAPVVDLDTYVTQLSDIVETEAVTLVVPVSEETLYVSVLKSRIPESVPVVCMHHDTLLQLYDKWTFNQLLVQSGLPAPKTCLADDEHSRTAVMSNDYIVKPRLSCSGQGVSFHESAELPAPVQINDATVLQQQLSGDLCCTFAIVASGNCLQVVAYRSLLNAGSVSVCFEQMTVPDMIRDLIASLATKLDYSGMLSFDFMQDSEGTWLAIECNPRATSGLHFLSHPNIVAALCMAAGQSDIKKPEQLPISGKPLRRQEFWSSLASVEGRLLRGRFNWLQCKALFSTRDVNWSWRDPLPCLLLAVIMWPQLWKAIRQRCVVAELLMQDVQWQQQSK